MLLMKFETRTLSRVYVMQDKIQNDMMYGDKASKAIEQSFLSVLWKGQ